MKGIGSSAVGVTAPKEEDGRVRMQFFAEENSFPWRWWTQARPSVLI